MPALIDFLIFVSSVEKNYMDHVEFEKLFKTHFTPLSNIAYTVVRDQDTARDIVQQVFIKLWNNLEKLSIQTSIKSYLHRAVVNTALNHIEKQKRFTLNEDMSAYDLKDEAPESEREFTKRETQDAIHAAIDQLPPKCKAVFSLSRFSGMTNKEIAEHLDVSVKAVEKHIGKALKELRVTLKPLINATLGLILFNYFTKLW